MANIPENSSFKCLILKSAQQTQRFWQENENFLFQNYFVGPQVKTGPPLPFPGCSNLGSHYTIFSPTPTQTPIGFTPVTKLCHLFLNVKLLGTRAYRNKYAIFSFFLSTLTTS